jgi:hypothetical protein
MKDTEKAVKKVLKNPVIGHFVAKAVGATVILKLADDLEKEMKEGKKDAAIALEIVEKYRDSLGGIIIPPEDWKKMRRKVKHGT